jgi:hypothetical protein
MLGGRHSHWHYFAIPAATGFNYHRRFLSTSLHATLQRRSRLSDAALSSLSSKSADLILVYRVMRFAFYIVQYARPGSGAT